MRGYCLVRAALVAREGKDNLKREFGNRSWRESELLKLEITIGGFGDGDLNVWVLY